jgi:Phage tail assembly chaperone protein
MPYFIAVNPNNLIITHAYEYTNVDPSRDLTAIHLEVTPPLDYRAVIPSYDSSSNIQLTPDTDKMATIYKWEYDAIRQQRNDLLYKSDWTCSVTDGPLTVDQKAAWATYREQLRNLQIEGTCPLTFIWPTPPS